MIYMQEPMLLKNAFNIDFERVLAKAKSPQKRNSSQLLHEVFPARRYFIVSYKNIIIFDITGTLEDLKLKVK
jgi:hypothetical protein